MPKRSDINSILIIGSGPIVIGQSCEFDYSGTQACRALREEGYRVILINSNPATIMTDKNLADATYLEPITSDAIENIIIKEKPDAILPTVGGQTALDITIKMDKAGILKKYNIELIGANINSIEKAENREEFKHAMDAVGIDTAKGGFAKTQKEANTIISNMDFPVIIRPSFTLGGTGGSVAYNIEEFDKLISLGLDARDYDQYVINKTNETSARVFPVVLNVYDKSFYRRLDKIVENNKVLSEIQNNNGNKLIKTLKKLPTYLSNGYQLLRLYLLKPLDSKDFQPSIR